MHSQWSVDTPLSAITDIYQGKSKECTGLNLPADFRRQHGGQARCRWALTLWNGNTWCRVPFLSAQVMETRQWPLACSVCVCVLQDGWKPFKEGVFGLLLQILSSHRVSSVWETVQSFLVFLCSAFSFLILLDSKLKNPCMEYPKHILLQC